MTPANPMDAPVAAPAEEPVENSVDPVSADPFVLDETRMASLSPEQRAALDPVFEEWKTKARSEIEKTGKTAEAKYKPHEEKSRALDELVKDPRFVQWWKGVQQAGASINPSQGNAIAQTKPQDFASSDEWQNAMNEAYAGDARKLEAIQARMFATMATPVIQQLKQGQAELKATLEMKSLFERHADAKELDTIGRDPLNPSDKSESLLEMCLNWADQNGRPMEDGYAKARSWADALKVGAKKEAMGLVQDKKQSVTSGPSTKQGGGPVIEEVADAEELMEKNMEYLASGRTPPRFVIRKTEAPTTGNRWSNRT